MYSEAFGYDSFSVVLVAIASLLCLTFYIGTRRPKGFPPGPIGLPIVGYIPFLGTNYGETLRRMKAKYGPVMSVQIGRDRCVVLNDFKTINEGLVKNGDIFSGRPDFYIFKLFNFDQGLGTADHNEHWKNLRKFGLTTLRGFGVGKKSMEENVIEEAPFLIQNLLAKSDVTLHTKFAYAVSNIISRVVFGERFTYDDRRFRTLVGVATKTLGNSEESRILGILCLAPELRYIPPFKSGLQAIMKELEIFDDHARAITAEHKVAFDENDIRDFIDAFLKEMKHKDPNDQTFNDLVLGMFIRDLFGAGTSTTSTALRWMILAFAHYPEIQERVAKEVMDIVGCSGRPSMKHREEMPYTQAFIQEVMRHRTPAPLSVSHKANGDHVMNGYRIPKNTTILPNIWSVHHDPELFDRPEEFRPERFIDDDGKFVKDPHVIPFSVGPRHCIGEQLARMELFVFIVAIVQKLNIFPYPEHPLPPFNKGKSTSLTYEGPDFEVKFECR